MSNNKMKGLLKGLRYISQIFDNDKEPEMQIGYPTDVKHVAHIGWDGPSVNSPSWMNEFKSSPGFSSAPLGLTGDVKEDASVKWVSEDSSRRSSRVSNSPARDLPELPKSSRRQSSAGGAVDSPTREKSDKPKSRRSSKSKDSSETIRSARQSLDSNQGNESPALSLPDIPRKSRRKKSKDSSVGGSARTRSKALVSETYQSPFSDPGSESNDNDLGQKTFEEGEDKEFT